VYTSGGCGSSCDAQPSTYVRVNWAFFPAAVKSTLSSETRGCSEEYNLLRSPFVIASPDLWRKSDSIRVMSLVGRGFITCQKEAACRVPLYKGGEI
jgi:hypothetical protein